MKRGRGWFILACCVLLVGCARPGANAVATPRDTLGGGAQIRAAALTPDGRTLATANPDRSITLWDLAAGRATRTLAGHTGNVTVLAFSVDGNTLASGGAEGAIRIWATGSGALTRAITGQASIDALAVNAEGTMVASGDNAGVVHLWQASDGQERQTLRGHNGAVLALAFNPAGPSLASGGQDRDLRIWDIGSGKELGRLVGHSGEVESASFSQDGKSLASGSADQTVKVWDLGRSQIKQTLTGHTGEVRAVAFNPSGSELASGSSDRTVKLWDLSKGQSTHTLSGHSDAIPAVAFTGDGRSVISGSLDSSARQWDAVSGRQQRAIDLRAAPPTASARPNPTVTTIAGAGTLALDGQPVPFTVARPNQRVAWTFSGTAGQQISVAVDAKTFNDADIVVTGPDGVRVNSRYSSGAVFLDSTTLPATGSYTLTFASRNADTGTGTITAYTFADTVGTITPGGPAVSASLTTPGQNARWTFTATAGQEISVVAEAKAIGDADIIVYAADGMRLGSRYIDGAGFLDTIALPGPGTYTLVLDPREMGVGGGTITAYAVTDTTATIAPGGPAQPFALATPGQNARFTFAGKAGQQISATVTGSTVDDADIILLKPDGTRLSSRYVSNDGFFDTITLTEDGPYTLVFDPRETDIGTGNLTVYNVADSSGAITIDGPAVPVRITTPGQRALFTFSGRAGQQITLEAISATIDSSDLAIVTPDGTTVIRRFVGNSGTAEATLPANGTYTLIYDPRETATGDASLTVRTKR